VLVPATDGEAAAQDGSFEGAEEVFERALATAEAIGDELELVMALGSSACARVAAGDVGKARALVERALRLLQASGSRYTAPDLLDTLASCAIVDRSYDDAAELIGTHADRFEASTSSFRRLRSPESSRSRSTRLRAGPGGARAGLRP
jgi:tetratricopeptide (TPR) repeat protein